MKKLLCFLGELNIDFQTDLAKALAQTVDKNDCSIDFVVNFNVDVASVLFGELEKRIIYIPDLDSYDGIIICPDTYGIPGLDEIIGNYLEKNAHCPVVSVRVEDDRFYSVLYDDYVPMFEMTEHLIEKHHLTRICFMTGRMELSDAHVRLSAYLDAMKKHNIEVTPGMIFYGDYWREKGDEALEFFLTKNEERPEAVVCSNDYMAIAVANAAIKRNLRIPDDIVITGLDDIDEARYYIPSITSIHPSTEQLADKIITMLKNVWSGNEQDKISKLPLENIYRNSCGCKKDIDTSQFQKLYLEKELYVAALNFSPYFGLEFENVDTFEELVRAVHLRLAYKAYGSPDDFGTIFFCMCDESEYNKEDAVEKHLNCTEYMYLKAIISGDTVSPHDIRFKRSELIPEEYRRRSSSLFIFDLHSKDDCYGYIAIQNDNIEKVKNIIKPLVFSINNALERIKMYSENQAINQIRAQSYNDPLTGIPNRRGMERYTTRLMERLRYSDEKYCLMSIDMDGLKYINDTFGHLEGDRALTAAANLLNDAKPDGGIICRTGGDEFVAIFISSAEKDATDFIARVEDAIKAANSTGEYPYELSVSIGYEFCNKDSDMLMSLHIADNKMYESKKKKKKNRKD